MVCESDDDKRKTILDIDRHIEYTVASDEIESLVGMMMSVGSLLDVISSKKGFRDIGKGSQKRKTMQRIRGMVHYQKNYIKYRFSKIRCFIKCIEILGNETTALRESYTDLENMNNILQGELDENIDKFELANSQDEVIEIAENIRDKISESFSELSKPIRLLETELRERAEGSIRIHLQNEDQKLADFANMIVNSNRKNSQSMEDMK